MKTELQDVLHLYLTTTDVEYQYPDMEIPNKTILMTSYLGEFYSDKVKLKPILRPISDMIDDEHRHLYAMLFKEDSDYMRVIKEGIISNIDTVGYKITYSPPKDNKLDKGYEWVMYRKLFPIQFLWMLRHSFDLFGLIESGQAIDIITLKK